MHNFSALIIRHENSIIIICDKFLHFYNSHTDGYEFEKHSNEWNLTKLIGIMIKILNRKFRTKSRTKSRTASFDHFFQLIVLYLFYYWRYSMQNNQWKQYLFKQICWQSVDSLIWNWMFIRWTILHCFAFRFKDWTIGYWLSILGNSTQMC